MEVRAYLSEKDNTVNFYITGEIGYHFEAGDFIRTMSYYAGYNVKMTMFSFGGSPFHAIAIYDYITSQNINLEVEIFGMCGSACTIMACASKNVSIGANSFFFIHNAYNRKTGEGSEMIDKVNNRMANIYAAKTGKSIEEMLGYMDNGDNDAVFDADEAKELGFVDAILQETKEVAARLKTGFLNENLNDFTAKLAPTKPKDEITKPSGIQPIDETGVKAEKPVNPLLEEKESQPPMIKSNSSEGNNNQQNIFTMTFTEILAQMARLFGVVVPEGSNEQETINNIANELGKHKPVGEIQENISANVIANVQAQIPSEVRTQIETSFADIQNRIQAVEDKGSSYANAQTFTELQASFNTFKTEFEQLQANFNTLKEEKADLEQQVIALKKPEGKGGSKGVDFTKAELNFHEQVEKFSNKTKY